MLTGKSECLYNFLDSRKKNSSLICYCKVKRYRWPGNVIYSVLCMRQVTTALEKYMTNDKICDTFNSFLIISCSTLFAWKESKPFDLSLFWPFIPTKDPTSLQFCCTAGTCLGDRYYSLKIHSLTYTCLIKMKAPVSYVRRMKNRK